MFNIYRMLFSALKKVWIVKITPPKISTIPYRFLENSVSGIGMCKIHAYHEVFYSFATFAMINALVF